MSTVVYVGSTIPDKKLVKEHTYRFHPDSSMREQIIKEVKNHSKECLDEYIVDVKIEVNLKLYDTKNT